MPPKARAAEGAAGTAGSRLLALAEVARRLAVPDALAARVADGALCPHEAAEELLVTAGIFKSF